MRKSSSSRRGFTLPEVLVTVTIVAVLAAVMVPAVINQVSKGDIPSMTSDLGGIRTAITAFAADTRKFPNSLSNLSGSSLVAAHLDIDGNAFGADAQTNYGGPYIASAGGPHTIPTGGTLADTFKLSGSLICLRDDTTAAGVSRVTTTTATQYDLAIDASNGKTTGLVQWTETVPGTIDKATLRVCVATK